MVRVFLLLCVAVSSLESTQWIKVPERLFRMSGSEVNTSEGDLLYKSQASGYYTGGGGMVVRSPVKNAQFANIQLPNIQAGCGGIDIYTGGFSFITGQQLVDTMQAVLADSPGYAFMLGLESISPSALNTMRQMQSWANAVNGIGINSCETAASLVGAVWPANDMASQHICRTVSTSNPLYKDYIEGRHKCSGKSKGETQETKMAELYKDFPLGKDYNIAWEALMQQPFFKDPGNKDLAEMYMTLVGTLVIKEGDSPLPYFSKAEDQEFIGRLLEGGKIKKYSCRDSKCLDVLEVDTDISSTDSWIAKMRKYLLSIQKKIINDEPFEDSEKGFLTTTKLPLLKFIIVLSAYHRGKIFNSEIDNIAMIVSWDIMAQIIMEAIETVRRGCLILREKNMYSTQIDKYIESLNRVELIVNRYEDHARKGLDIEMRMIEKIKLLEKQVYSEIMVR